MTRFFHVWFSWLMLLASVTACVPIMPPQVEAASNQSVTLRVATGDSNEGLVPHREIIRNFEQANPNIHIQLEPVSGSNYYDLLQKQITDGNPPDILHIGDDAVPLFVRQGALLDLGPFMRGASPLDINMYLPGVMQPGAWQGKQYLLPKDFSPLAVYYNKKIFNAMGVSFPKDGWTWEDFLITAQLLTRDINADGKPEMWGVQLPAAWTSGFEYWVAASGGKLVSEDGKSFQGYMDSDATVQALQFYTSLYNTYHVAPPPVGVLLFGGGNNEFLSGKAAMYLFGHWTHADLAKNPLIDLGVVGLPVGKSRANVLLWSGFGISSKTAHPNEAWKFLRYYAGEPGAQVWKDWGLPTVKSVAEASGMTRDPLESVWFKELSYLAPRAYIFTPYWGETGDPALQAVLGQALTEPNVDARGLLQNAAQQAQKKLDGKR